MQGHEAKKEMSVRLNDTGLLNIFGTAVGLSYMKTKVYRLTYVGHASMCDDSDVRFVNVGDPELNKFMLDTSMFDKA